MVMMDPQMQRKVLLALQTTQNPNVLRRLVFEMFQVIEVNYTEEERLWEVIHAQQEMLDQAKSMVVRRDGELDRTNERWLNLRVELEEAHRAILDHRDELYHTVDHPENWVDTPNGRLWALVTDDDEDGWPE